MSLLEDVFLQDEAGEAQELERIIEGDEYDERPRTRASSPDSNDDSEKEDEAEEDKRHVDPTSKPKRIVKNPRVILNPARLTGPRGIQVIPEHFKDFKFKGKGHEKEDLDLVLKKLEHWAYRLFPKFEFKDCLKKIETLGNKRPVMVHLTKIRTDQFLSEDTVVQHDSGDDEAPQPVEEDEFDKLLQQQIELARAAPAPTSNITFTTPLDKSLTMPKVISSPSINDEQRERMLRNRQLAEERRLARLKQNNSEANTSTQENFGCSTANISKDSDKIENVTKINSNSEDTHTAQDDTINDTDQIIDEEENVIKAKINRSNVIDSSDEEDSLVINESVTVDVHDSHRNDDSDEDTLSDNVKSNINDEIEAIREESDIEMNEIDATDLRHNNIDFYKETDNPTNLHTNSDVINENLDKIHSEAVVSHTSKHFEININNCSQVEDKENKTDEGIEETDKEGKTSENEMQDVMDIQFSDDF